MSSISLFRCSDPSFRFLLESMQNVHRLRKPNRINDPPSVAAMWCDHFHHRPPTKPFQRLRRGIGFPLLSGIQRLAMSRRTSWGNARRSLRLDPIQIIGRPVSLLYINTYVSISRPNKSSRLQAANGIARLVPRLRPGSHAKDKLRETIERCDA